MLDAICTYDKDHPITYSVFEFKALPEADIDKFRYSLICPDCQQKAYFRRASSDGRQACFGSRYHHQNCAEYNPSARKKEEEKSVAEVEEIVVSADSLVIDFTLPDKKKIQSIATTEKITEKGNTLVKDNSLQTKPREKLASATKESNEVKVSKQGLAKLLTSLLRGSSLATSDLWIYTSEKHKWRAKNLFVNIADAQPTDNGAPRLYWGTISHADKALDWLNPAEDRGVGLPIRRYRDALLKRFSIESSEDIEGAGFILFGKCVLSRDKKRRYIQLWGNDLQYFYLSKAE